MFILITATLPTIQQMLDMFGLQAQPLSQLPSSQLSSQKTQSSTNSFRESASKLAEHCLNLPYGKNTVESSDDEFMDAQSNQGDRADQADQEVVEAVWELEFVHPNMDDCTLAINEEACWTKQRTLPTQNGIKTGYRCKHVKRRGKQCSAGIYTIHNFEPNNTAVKLFRKNLAHDHGTNENRVTAISDEVKKNIIRLFELGYRPKGIMYQLQQDPENVVPNIDRVRNVIEVYKQQKYGKSNVTMNDLQKFYNDHSAIPIDDDEAFVTGFQRSNVEDDDKWFRLFITTKRLLMNSIKAECMHADGTYKLNVQNYPILSVGTTDMEQRLHLLGLAISTYERAEDYEFMFDTIQDAMRKVSNNDVIKPRALMADGAAAIHNGFRKSFAHIENKRVLMCWYHVLHNVNKQKFRKPKNKDAIKRDLYSIHFLYSEELFDEAMKLFREKWSV